MLLDFLLWQSTFILCMFCALDRRWESRSLIAFPASLSYSVFFISAEFVCLRLHLSFLNQIRCIHKLEKIRLCILCARYYYYFFSLPSKLSFLPWECSLSICINICKLLRPGEINTAVLYSDFCFSEDLTEFLEEMIFMDYQRRQASWNYLKSYRTIGWCKYI